MADNDQAEFEAWKAARDAAKAGDAPVEYYVHLADGNVVKLSDSDMAAAGSHYDGIAVIASYRVGA